MTCFKGKVLFALFTAWASGSFNVQTLFSAQSSTADRQNIDDDSDMDMYADPPQSIEIELQERSRRYQIFGSNRTPS